MPCHVVSMYVIGNYDSTLGTQVHAPALSSQVCACLHSPVASRAKINTPQLTNMDTIEHEMRS